MKLYIFMLAALLALASCSDDDNAVPDNHIAHASYRFDYMVVPGSVAGGADALVDATFTDGKITKLVGGFSLMDQASGWNYAFNKDLYRDISYQANTATIVNKTSFPGMTALEQKQIVTFDNSGKPLQKVVISDYDQNYRDTIQYIYENNRLKRLEKRHNRLLVRSEIYYNAQANVDSIVTRTAQWIDGAYQINSSSLQREVTTFETYDQTPSPFSGFIIFDEVFYRAISANNYKKMMQIDYDANGFTNTYTMQWNFVYENGLINFAL